jgi:hypothetical protein
VTIDEVWIGNWVYRTLALVTANNYYSHSDMHTLKIAVTTVNIMTSEASLAVAWYLLPTAGVPVLRTVRNLNYQLLTHNCNS